MNVRFVLAVMAVAVQTFYGVWASRVTWRVNGSLGATVFFVFLLAVADTAIKATEAWDQP